jgi:hypothetical protein
MKKTFERAEIFAQKRADKTEDKKQSKTNQPTKKYKKDPELYHILPDCKMKFQAFEKLADTNKNVSFYLLPGIYRQFAEEVKNVLNLPDNYIFGCIIGAISTAIGNSIKIRSNSYTNTSTLYLLLVGGSGSGKTPALSKIMEPLKIIEGRKTMEYKVAFANWKQQKEDEGAARGNKPEKESIKITGGNLEGVLKRLEATPKGMSIINDELAGFFNALNMYRKGDDVQNYLSIWSNEDIDTIRKTSEEGYYIKNPFLNIIGGIQTGTLKKIVSQIGDEDGMLWRLLPCLNTQEILPYSNGGAIDPILQDNYNNAIISLYDTLYHDTISFNQETKSNFCTPKTLALGMQGNIVYTDYVNFCKYRMNNTPNEQIKEILAKIQIYCLRFALILHVSKYGSNIEKYNEVDEDTLFNAIQLSEFFFASMKDCYDIVNGEIENIFGLNVKYSDFYNALPNDEFKRSAASDICLVYEISERSSDEFLKRKDLFKKVKYGTYKKVENQ